MNRALLVGLNHYSPQLSDKLSLNGCIGDVRDMANTLMIGGYDSNTIDIITNERATASNVKKRLQSMVKSSRPGDYIMFYFAGYGSRITERNAPTGSVLYKSKEILCPYDMYFPDHSDTDGISSRSYISDQDVIDAFSKSSKNVEVEIILDCGFSNSNAVISESTIKSGLSGGSRYMLPPLEHEFYPHEKFLWSFNFQKVFLPNGSPVSLWTGAADNQSSHEVNIDGQIRGLFTHHFCSALRESSMRIRRDVLCGLINSKIRQSGFAQTVMLHTSSETLQHSAPDHFPPV